MAPHTQRDLERILNARIDALHYNFTQFEVRHYIHHLETFTHRRIEVHRVPLQHNLYGVCVDAQSAFYIFINDRLHPLHFTHTLLHESAHLLLNHTSRDITGALPETVMQLFGGSGMQGYVHPTPNRLADDDVDEQEAELFAMLFRRRLIAARRLHELFCEPTSIDAYADQFYALGFNQGGGR